MGRLDNKLAIVTGANSGMGMATVEALSDEGAKVIMLCRNEKRGVEACKKLMEKKDFEKISVGEIAEVAGVHRATFYRHFTSKEDVVVQYLSNLLTSSQDQALLLHAVPPRGLQRPGGHRGPF